MTTGWRFPLAVFAFTAWYVLIVADTIQDLITEHKGRAARKETHNVETQPTKAFCTAGIRALRPVIRQ